MTHTHKLTEAREQVNRLAVRKRSAAERMDAINQREAKARCDGEAAGLEMAASVIKDLLTE